ncbi:ThiF family adenylyltransferase, partial [Halioglobus sp. HI00S01]
DIGRNKAVSAAASIADINPGVTVTTLTEHLAGDALAAAVQAVDLVVDCSDNFPTRFALNRACIAAGIPMVSA